MPAASKTLAFCLYKYFPFGGLQRDFMRIALACQARGYLIRVYALTWEGGLPEGFDLRLIQVKALSNHTRYERYNCQLQADLQTSPVTAVIGFNKMPGLDVYYAADPCYEAKAREQRGLWYRLSPRYKHFYRYEKAVFDEHAKTEVLMIAAQQKPLFQQYYRTPDQRLHMLPPGISRDRMAPVDAARIRAAFRAEFGLSDEDHLLLMIGSGFKTKGVDRSIKALAQLPDSLRQSTHLFVIGQDNPQAFIDLAHRLSVADNFRILSGRDDVPRFLLGADLLVHPAYNENTGTVLLEAVVAGLPVLVNDVCGYAHYVADAQAGRVMSSPFDLAVFAQVITDMLLSPEKTQWQQNGIAFSKTADIYDMPEHAADIIAQVVNDLP